MITYFEIQNLDSLNDLEQLLFNAASYSGTTDEYKEKAFKFLTKLQAGRKLPSFNHGLDKSDADEWAERELTQEEYLEVLSRWQALDLPDDDYQEEVRLFVDSLDHKVICPKCGSSNTSNYWTSLDDEKESRGYLEIGDVNADNLRDVGGSVSLHVCNSCGQQFALPI